MLLIRFTVKFWRTRKQSSEKNGKHRRLVGEGESLSDSEERVRPSSLLKRSGWTEGRKMLKN